MWITRLLEVTNCRRQMTAERQQDWLDQLGVAFERLCSGADSPLAYHFTDCQVLAGRSRFALRVNPKRKTKRGELARDAVFTPTEVRPMLNAAGFNFSKVPSSEHLRVSGNLPSELKFLAAGACTAVPCLRIAVRWRL